MTTGILWSIPFIICSVTSFCDIPCLLVLSLNKMLEIPGQMALASGAGVDTGNTIGWTALILAAGKGKSEVVKVWY